MLKESDIEFGRWISLIKLVICYGSFAESVFRLVFDYNHDMYNVRWYAPGVIRLLRMIGMLLWVGIGQNFRLCYNRELKLWAIWKTLFLIYAVQKAETFPGRVAWLLWQIWAACNDVIWNYVHHTSTSIERTALGAWQQWQEVHKQPSPPVMQHKQSKVQSNNSIWEKLSEMWLKCNVDAVFHDCNHITSFACCVRNFRVQFSQAQTKWQQTNMTVLEGEAVALLEALHFVDANK